MPELPEVETIKKDLVKKILQKNIIKIEVLKKNLVKNKLNYFLNTIKNNVFLKISRIGKLIILELKNKNYLLIHLRMTGQLVYVEDNNIIAGGHNFPQIDNLPNKYSHIIFTFKDNSKLFFNDIRQFGYLKIVKQEEKNRIIKKYGLDLLAHNFTIDNFSALFKDRKSILKVVLLNQKIIAGIGNIYADEICFRAKVLPQRKINTLDQKDLVNLYKATNYIISKSLKKKGTTFNNYCDSEGRAGNYYQYLKVYKKEKNKCLRCKKGIIVKILAAGRGTRYCPFCQK